MTLPNLSDLVSGTTSEGQFQAAMTTLYNHVAQTIGAEAPEELDIVLGSVTPTRALVKIDTENSSPTDDLDHVVATNLTSRLLILQSTDASRVVTVKHNISGSGKFALLDDVDVDLTSPDQYMLLRHNQVDDTWYELDRNFGFLAPTAAIKAALRTKLGLTDIATRAIGTASGQIPSAELLGALAFISSVGTDQIVDNAITGAKVLAGSLPLSKLANGTPGRFMGYNDTTGVPEEKEITTEDLLPPEIFTSSGTWTKPVGFTGQIKVTVVGGGGGGAGGGTTNSGGTSSFGAHCSASGGGAGQTGFSAGGRGGTAGVGSGGDINFRGCDGGGAYLDQNSRGTGGTGGNSFLGGGGYGDADGSSSSSGFSNGRAYGGGGGGNTNLSIQVYSGGGGGGGGCAIKWLNAADLGATETVTIGGGGAGGGGNGAAGVIIVEYIK